MSWIKAGVTLVGAAAKYYGDKKAAAAQQKGYDAATAEQRRQFDLAREDQMPWLQAGQRALHQLEQLNSGNFSSFTASPDYQFALTEGLKGLDRSAAARGALWSGGADADRMAYASGLATQNYGNYYNRLASLAGLGQTTASGLGTLGANYASNAGRLALGAADARASSYRDQADTMTQLVGSGGDLLADWYRGRRG